MACRSSSAMYISAQNRRVSSMLLGFREDRVSSMFIKFRLATNPCRFFFGGGGGTTKLHQAMVSEFTVKYIYYHTSIYNAVTHINAL